MRLSRIQWAGSRRRRELAGRLYSVGSHIQAAADVWVCGYVSSPMECDSVAFRARARGAVGTAEPSVVVSPGGRQGPVGAWACSSAYGMRRSRIPAQGPAWPEHSRTERRGESQCLPMPGIRVEEEPGPECTYSATESHSEPGTSVPADGTDVGSGRGGSLGASGNCVAVGRGDGCLVRLSRTPAS